MTISVCLLTRNEEAHLGRALASVAGVADQVIVMDTGSTDRTVEIAKAAQAEVHAMRWDDDFAAGRNATIDLARGDWILWLQPDEAWIGPRRDELLPWLADGVVFGYLATIRNRIASDRVDLFSETKDLRLYRRVPELRFVGRLHPRFTEEFAATVRSWGRSIVPSPVTIESLAHLGVKTRDKAIWTLRLLDRELADRPGQLAYQIERCRTLQFLGDSRAHAAWVEAAEAVLAVRDAPNAPTVKVQYVFEYVLANEPVAELGGLDRRTAIILTLRWFRDSPPLLWTIARNHYVRREYAESAAVLEHLVSLGREGSFDRSRTFDTSIIGDQALMNLGDCNAKIGRIDQARSCFHALLANPKFGTAAASYLEVLKGA